MKLKEIQWYKNIEHIFTKETLDYFVKEKILMKVKHDGETHYIKYGCRWDFKKQMKEHFLK